MATNNDSDATAIQETPSISPEFSRHGRYVWRVGVAARHGAKGSKQNDTISLARARRIALAMLRRRGLVREAREWVAFEDAGGGDVFVPGPLSGAVTRALALDRFGV